MLCQSNNKILNNFSLFIKFIKVITKIFPLPKKPITYQKKTHPTKRFLTYTQTLQTVRQLNRFHLAAFQVASYDLSKAGMQKRSGTNIVLIVAFKAVEVVVEAVGMLDLIVPPMRLLRSFNREV